MYALEILLISLIFMFNIIVIINNEILKIVKSPRLWMSFKKNEDVYKEESCI